MAVYDRGTGAQRSQLMGIEKAGISRSASFPKKQLIKNRAGFGRNLEFVLAAQGRSFLR
jgi:hypothetical protein